MARPVKKYLTAGLLTAAATILGMTNATAGTFDGGIPAAWNCTGSCGASAADGVVSLAPNGGSQYGWVSTNGSGAAASLAGVGGSGNATNGSALQSSLFHATAGSQLNFQFNYVTSDGAGYSDYAWARLVDGNNNQVALLFTARTTTNVSSVPGFAMPAPEATLTPSSVSILPGSNWAALGGDSGQCYDIGCGNTGWIGSKYTIANAGNYKLEFGVTNWNDQLYQSGMAFDGITVGGTPIPTNPVPEPESYAMLMAGLGLLGVLARRRSAKGG